MSVERHQTKTTLTVGCKMRNSTNQEMDREKKCPFYASMKLYMKLSRKVSI